MLIFVSTRELNNDMRKIHDLNINLQYLELKWRGWHAQILPDMVMFINYLPIE
jgi:hypothetical protein